MRPDHAALTSAWHDETAVKATQNKKRLGKRKKKRTGSAWLGSPTSLSEIGKENSTFRGLPLCLCMC